MKKKKKNIYNNAQVLLDILNDLFAITKLKSYHHLVKKKKYVLFTVNIVYTVYFIFIISFTYEQKF